MQEVAISTDIPVRTKQLSGRDCGTCTACCVVPLFEELNKPARTPCQHLCGSGGGCEIYHTRPQTCKDFVCSWVEGIGHDDDWPDNCGVMTWLTEMNGGTWIFVVELWKDAATTTGARMLTSIANKSVHPLIISNFDTPPEEDYGDRVVIKKELLPRTELMRGEHLEFLDADEEVGVYELIKE